MSSKEQIVIGYKGGYFDCFGVNVEFLDCPKFEVLHSLIFGYKGREKKEKFCCFHARRRFTENNFHCARQEVILFSCFILKNRKDEYTSLLNKYGCC